MLFYDHFLELEAPSERAHKCLRFLTAAAKLLSTKDVQCDLVTRLSLCCSQLGKNLGNLSQGLTLLFFQIVSELENFSTIVLSIFMSPLAYPQSLSGVLRSAWSPRHGCESCIC